VAEQEANLLLCFLCPSRRRWLLDLLGQCPQSRPLAPPAGTDPELVLGTPRCGKTLARKAETQVGAYPCVGKRVLLKYLIMVCFTRL